MKWYWNIECIRVQVCRMIIQNCRSKMRVCVNERAGALCPQGNARMKITSFWTQKTPDKFQHKTSDEIKFSDQRYRFQHPWLSEVKLFDANGRSGRNKVTESHSTFKNILFSVWHYCGGRSYQHLNTYTHLRLIAQFLFFSTFIEAGKLFSCSFNTMAAHEWIEGCDI